MQSLRDTARYWVPIVAGFSCLLIGSQLVRSTVGMLVLLVVGLLLMLDGITKAWERNGSRGGLSDNQQ
jgi:hypothetical protein